MSAEQNLFLYHLVLADEYRNSNNWTEDTRNLIREHAQFLADLGKKGKLGFAGRTDFKTESEHLFGIALIKANDLESAKKLLAEDPAVVHGIQKASVFPFIMPIKNLNNLE